VTADIKEPVFIKDEMKIYTTDLWVI